MNQRFAFALERLDAKNWARFERFASEFLAPEWRDLRTVAAPSGDQGRDSELFSPDAPPAVLIQYSVTLSWDRKIRETLERVSGAFPSARVLVYLSNQEIGARADDVRKDAIQKYKIVVDIRDRNWFLDRAAIDPQREALAEQLAAEIADPYLTSRNLIESKAQALSSIEIRAALVYLGLQWEDDTREKGLTRLCFEALVKAALRDTNPEKRLSRAQVKEAVRAFLSTHKSDQVDVYTDSALQRITKRAISHFAADDSFCLVYEERRRLAETLARQEEGSKTFDSELDYYVASNLQANDKRSIEPSVQRRVRRVLEKFLLKNGEIFASAVNEGNFSALGVTDVRPIVVADVAEIPVSTDKIDTIDFVERVVADVLVNPTDHVRRGLRLLADSYTLMAFLRETPDVQSAVTKMFAQGDIWLDTSAVLPLFGHDLDLPVTQKFTTMTKAAIEAGLKLHVTPGVLEEIDRHFNRCLAFCRTPGSWHGRVPFLCSAYALTGRAVSTFPAWAERFRGEGRPTDDLADYLTDFLNIDLRDLDEETYRAAESELRFEAERQWYQIQKRRRQTFKDEIDENTLTRLTKHDVENMIGVLVRQQRGQKSSAFGYTNWCLTLDRSAPVVFKKLVEAYPELKRFFPFLSADFLLNYLAFGPVRRQVSKDTEAALPVILEGALVPVLPSELLAVAEKVRAECGNLPEYVVRRRVRDALDEARRRIGPMAIAGLDEVERAYSMLPH